MENRFRESLIDPKTLSITWELVPGRGAREKSQEATLEAAQEAAKGTRIHALTITDNPGGNPALLADYLGSEILEMGIEPLVHFTCKDKNRVQMESQLYALDRAGIRNLLVITGDYVGQGYAGKAKPVFDLDPIHALQLIDKMNEGLEVPGPKGTVKHQPSDFWAGAAVSPFKSTEAELISQYFKLTKKITGGAKFIVTQVGYDARKFHELLQFARLNKLNIPIVGNIYILPYGAAKVMNQNRIPGVVVTDKLVAELDREREAADKGLEARMLRAAKMYAFMKGMGFDGVHIGGHGIKYQQVEYIIDKGEELSKNWRDLVREFDYPQEDGFYFYQRDEKTGLNTEETTNRVGRPLDAPVEGVYRLSRFMHNLMFEPDKPLFPVMRKISKLVHGSKFEKTYHKVEHLSKVALFDCKDCGDCALTDVAYVCPMSQCPKNQRNGPCGGSRDGWCEVNPDKKCAWVRAYSRLKQQGEEEKFRDHIVPPPDWDLHQTSSWNNFFLGRDHSAKRFGILTPEEEKRAKEK